MGSDAVCVVLTATVGMALRRLRPEQEMHRTRERRSARLGAACCSVPQSCRGVQPSSQLARLCEGAALPQPSDLCAGSALTPRDPHTARAEKAMLASMQRRPLPALVCDCCAALSVNTDVLAGKWVPASQSVA